MNGIIGSLKNELYLLTFIKMISYFLTRENFTFSTPIEVMYFSCNTKPNFSYRAIAGLFANPVSTITNSELCNLTAKSNSFFCNTLSEI